MQTTAVPPNEQSTSPGDGPAWLSHALVWGMALVILAIYLMHAAAGAWWGDGQEFACAAWTLGIPHPTGYPLYVVLGHVWMKLLVGLGMSDPGRALTWLGALELALGLGLIGRVLKRIALENPARLPLGIGCACGLRVLLPALGLMLMLGFGRTVFEHATFAEVYPLTFMLVAAVVNLAWRTTRSPNGLVRWRGAALGLVFGLALLNHYSILALAPLALIAALAWERRSNHPWHTLGLALGCGALMLLGYLYLPLRARANPPINWGNPDNFARLKWVLSGGQFTDLKIGSAHGAAWAGLMHWLEWWGSEWVPKRYLAYFPSKLLGLALLGAAGFGLGLLWRRHAGLASGLMCSIGCTAIFAAMYHIPDIDAYFMVALPAAGVGWLIAFQWLLARLSELAERGKISAQLAQGPFIRMVPLVLGLLIYIGLMGEMDKAGDDAPQVWGEAALKLLPPGAMILTQGDQDIYSLWYQQMVLGKRPDVTVFGTQFIFSGWYARFFDRKNIVSQRPLTVTWAEDRKPGDKIDYDVALFRHILLPNLEQGQRVYTTFVDPLFAEYLTPVPVEAAPLLPPAYVSRTDYPFGLPSPVLYELHPNPGLSRLNEAALAQAFARFYSNSR